MKLIKKIETFRLVGGVIVVIVTLVWAIFSYLDLHKQAELPDVSYTVCISDMQATCPDDAMKLACNAPIASWVKKSCPQYSLQTRSKKLGGKCGTSIVDVTCL